MADRRGIQFEKQEESSQITAAAADRADTRLGLRKFGTDDLSISSHGCNQKCTTNIASCYAVLTFCSLSLTDLHSLHFII